MRKVIILTIAMVLVWGVSAWAEDDGWDEWDRAWAEFNGDSHSSSNAVAERTLRASEPIYRNVVREDGSTYQEAIYRPDYHNHGEAGVGYNPDQVYGPMWGVPGEAVGMDGYEPFYMMQFLGADPNDIPDEYRSEVLRREAQLQIQRGVYHAENPEHDGAAAAPVQRSHTEDEPTEEGNGIREEDDWLD